MNTHPQDPVLRERDWTIAERLDEIERVLKFDPHVPYRRQLVREFLELTTDPQECPLEAAKWRRTQP